MSKRKLTADEAVADILRFLDIENEVEDDDFSDALDKIYDCDDLNAAQNKIVLMIKTPLAVKESVEFDIQWLPQKILLKKRLVNSIDKSLDEIFYDLHDFGDFVAENLASEKVIVAFLGQKKRQEEGHYMPLPPLRGLVRQKYTGLVRVNCLFEKLLIQED